MRRKLLTLVRRHNHSLDLASTNQASVRAAGSPLFLKPPPDRFKQAPGRSAALEAARRSASASGSWRVELFAVAALKPPSFDLLRHPLHSLPLTQVGARQPPHVSSLQLQVGRRQSQPTDAAAIALRSATALVLRVNSLPRTRKPPAEAA